MTNKLHPSATQQPSRRRGDGEPRSRDHLFISYAWEDGALAEWLVRKLTAEGYRVWCDRFKILGGERWPKDVDVAIKTRTFRMLGLLSEYSLEKLNPCKERQMALTLCKERDEEFLIPLNVDGRLPSEIGWEMSDINFIPFQSWSAGLAQLLKKLESINTPRPLGERGRDIAVETFLPKNVLRDDEETLYSNCLRVSVLPKMILRFRLSRRLAQFETRALEQEWAFVKKNDAEVLAFTSPNREVLNKCAAECKAEEIDRIAWMGVSTVHEIRTTHLISSLVKKSLLVKCAERGLIWNDEGTAAFFPEGLLPKDAISFRNYKGNATHVGVLGERAFGKGRFRYRLGISFWVRSNMLDALVVETKVQLKITDPSKEGLTAHGANARRKKVTKSWWNHEWLSRQLALVAFLRGTDENITIGESEGEQIQISGEFVQALVTPSIDDQALEPLAAKVEAMNFALSQDVEEDDGDSQVSILDEDVG